MESQSSSTRTGEDTQRIQARIEIMKYFVDERNRPKKTPYYISQLQVLMENNFFSWIVYNAAMDLLKRALLSKLEISTKYSKKMIFLFSQMLENEPDRERVIRRAKSIGKLVDKHASPDVTRSLGKHLEALVRNELRVQGFQNIVRNSNEFHGKKWTETSHNLDLIAEHVSGKLNIGVEVKNEMALMSDDEIRVKMRICQYLGLTPVFAVRWIKPYTEMIREKGGLSWVFKTQIFPPGFEKLTKELYRRLSLPVNVRTELPEKSINIFAQWVARNTR